MLQRVLPNFCAGCSRSLPCNALVCSNCETSMDGPLFYTYSLPAIDRAYSFWWYEPPLSEIIRQFKFSGRLRISKYLSGMLFRTVIALSLDTTIPIVPVPTTLEALRRRGFDTNMMILQSLRRKIDMSIETMLSSTGRRQQQSSVEIEKRRENVEGGFMYVAKNASERVLLFDDVVTSGSTAVECAKTLKRGGINEVVLLSLARSR